MAPELSGTAAYSRASRLPRPLTSAPVVDLTVHLLPRKARDLYWPDHDHYYLDLRFVDVPRNLVVYGETEANITTAVIALAFAVVWWVAPLLRERNHDD